MCVCVCMFVGGKLALNVTCLYMNLCIYACTYARLHCCACEPGPGYAGTRLPSSTPHIWCCHLAEPSTAIPGVMQARGVSLCSPFLSLPVVPPHPLFAATGLT